MGRPKEVCYFQDQIDFKTNVNYEKGWDWYQQAFSHYQGESHIGEATPSYSDRTRSPNTAKRIHLFNPAMKLIYLVRDPLARQFSAWQMQHYEGLQGIHPERIETQWALKGFDYWMREQKSVGQWDICRYDYQLDAYRQYFPTDSILVSFLEDWKYNQDAELRRICNFLSLDPRRLRIERPEGSNRAEDKKIPPLWFARLQKSRAIRVLGKLAPRSLKWRAGMAVMSAPKIADKSELSDKIRTEFTSYVQSDALRVLQSHNRDSEMWSSLHGN